MVADRSQRSRRTCEKRSGRLALEPEMDILASGSVRFSDPDGPRTKMR
jgi:hypothetical protein